MAAKPSTGEVIGQMSFFVPPEVEAPELPPGTDLERRASISHVITSISNHLNLPSDYTTQADLDSVEPREIEKGLYYSRWPIGGPPVKNVYRGVGFTGTQFSALTLSPSALGVRVFGKAVKANEQRPPEERLDRDVLEATASRAAGHALERNETVIEILIGDLAQKRMVLLGMHSALKGPGYAHHTIGKLDEMRKSTSNAIHECIEIAATNLPWDDQEVSDRQKALHYNMYGHPEHNNRRITHWRRYVLMAGRLTRMQIERAGHSLEMTKRELEHYLPALEAARRDQQET